MIIKSIELADYRNYDFLTMEFDKGTNILYGDNAQGKTNILEAIYVAATTKSHRGSKDREIVNFDKDEAHIRTYVEKDGVETRIDMHLRKAKSKGIAIDGQKIKKAAELLGLCNVVFFSPEDLGIIKNGPAERRRFVDMELCQLDSFYLYNLNHYNKIVNQRNKLLKDMYMNPDLRETLNIWDMQLVSFGSKIIERRKLFVEQLNEIIYELHKKLSGDKEELVIKYEPDVEIEEFEKKLKCSQDRDMKSKMTSVGPHRDDFSFMVGDVDIRKFGSQGQQRTAALSLKLSEIELVKKIAKDTPILLLDDVLSELDSNRQNYLLNSIGDVQTIITCTGLEEFVNNRFQLNKVYRVTDGNKNAIKIFDKFSLDSLYKNGFDKLVVPIEHIATIMLGNPNFSKVEELQITLAELSEQKVDLFNISTITEQCRIKLKEEYPELVKIERFSNLNVRDDQVLNSLKMSFGDEFEINRNIIYLD